MRIRVCVTVKLDKEQVKTLVKSAKLSGHSYDGTKAPSKLIRRLLEGKVHDAVTYCHVC